MKYLFSDFRFLAALTERSITTLGDAYGAMCHRVGMYLPVSALQSTVSVLLSDGYITVSEIGRVLMPATTVNLTDKGRAAVSISWLARLADSERALKKKELSFCTQERPTVSMGASSWLLQDFSGVEDSLKIACKPPLFALSETDDGDLCFHIYCEDAALCDDDAVSENIGEASDADAAEEASSHERMVVGKREMIQCAVADLLTAVHALLTEPPRPRKVAVHGYGQSYIITMVETASDLYGSALRLTVAPIRYNRQRFFGKRDGELDYAQCGEEFLRIEMEASALTLADAILPLAVALPHRLTEDMANGVEALHRAVARARGGR